ncbi:MAG: tetratricopeptide repeat protein [bacterium]|nr:tetratricopeptide repeat protein [bacterium]
MDRCLKPDELAAFLAGSLSAEDMERFNTHISSCSRCREVVGNADRDVDAPTEVDDPNATLTLEIGSGDKPGETDLIEGYKILHEIHRGGQGVVYKAVQKATKRTVALKVLLHGPFASARQQHRFEREIDLIASIQHPNIVTVYDSGLAQGRYYFAMEYIHGTSFDRYLADAKPSIEARLKLFMKICDAVNAAHQRGVIHRDLKPDNISVDTEGEPHILDFGLAKTAGHDLQDDIPMTVPGEFKGTLAYASPEQACGDPRLVDIRTDVYSLGVILFEMLTGKYPYRVIGPVPEVLRDITEAEPSRPSTHDPRINDEIETIILKSLAKEKDRRYQTANALAGDIERYLAGEPLDAKRDSTWYVLRKSLRRYRFVAGMVAAIVLVLAGSTIALSIMYRNQSRARSEAETARHELEIVTAFQQSMLSEIDAEQMGQALYADLRDHLRADLEAEGLVPAENEAAIARFDSLLNRTNATDISLTLLDEQILDRAARTIESDFADQPLIRATLQQTVADTYWRIGRYPPALPLQESALQTRRSVLGEDHEVTLNSQHSMGSLLASMGRFEEAHDHYAEALAGQRRVLGDEHPATLTTISSLGLLAARMGGLEEAHALYQEALEGRQRVLGDDHEDTMNSLNNMATLLESMGEFEEALVYFHKALEGKRRIFGDDHPTTLSVINNLGNLLHQMGQGEEALRYHSEALEIRRRIQGDDHPETLVSIANMGGLLMSMGKHEQALVYLREALEGNRRALGDDHPYTLITINYMGALLKRMGRLQEAEPYYREALEGNRRVLGNDHLNTITVVHNMGNLLRELGRFDEAEEYGARAVSWARESLPAPHPHTAEFLWGYGVTLIKLGHLDEAEAVILEAHGMLLETVGENHRRTIDFARELVNLYETWHLTDPIGGHDAKASAWRARLDSAPEEPSSP